MRWQKLGKIFDPEIIPLTNGCTSFAKSPQALVFDDFVRVYFCSQVKSPDGKYLSHPQFVDFDKDFKKIINYSKESVISLGQLGEFDEHGIFPLNVLRCKNQIYGFTSGWSRRTSVSIDMSIGLSVSHDNGKSFAKYGQGGPVMTSSIKEPCLVGDPFVLFINDTFHMWYIFGDRWVQANQGSPPERFYRIAYASSKDGLNWNRNGNYIISTLYENECQALPTVFILEGRFHMIFCHRNAFGFRTQKQNSYRLGYAYSDDMKNWTRDDSMLGINLGFEEWDSEMMCYPNAFKMDSDVYLLYNGNQFGKHGFGLAKLLEI